MSSLPGVSELYGLRCAEEDANVEDAYKSLKRSKSGYAAALTVKGKQLRDLINAGSDIKEVHGKLMQVHYAYDNYTKAHDECFVIAPDEEQRNLEISFKDVQTKFYMLDQETRIYISRHDNLDIRPSDSVSQAKAPSITTSVGSSRAKAAAKKAALAVRVRFLKQQQELESQMSKQKLDLEHKKQELSLKIELEAAEAEESILADIEENEDDKVCGQRRSMKPPTLIHHDQYVDTREHNPWLSGIGRHALNPQAPEYHGPAEVGTVGAEGGLSQLQHQQRVLIDVLQLPKTEIMEFHGDPLQYWTFMSAFDDAVDKAIVDPRAKLTRLLHYCKGKALKVIQSCAVMKDHGYDRARALLKQRFGNDYQIAESWIRKITDGPQLKPTDRSALQDLADDVRSCRDTLAAMDKSEEIDTRRSMSQIVSRLPLFLLGRWRREAIKTLERSGRYPGIDKLVYFLDSAANEMNDPVFGHIEERMTKDNGKGQRSTTSKKRDNSFNIQASTQDKSAECKSEQHVSSRKPDSKPEKRLPPVCPLCTEGHLLITCRNFLKMSPGERLDLARDKRLCFNCLQYSNHSARRCMRKSTCDVQDCNRKHSKLLHDRNGASGSVDAPDTSQRRVNSPTSFYERDSRSTDVKSYACRSTPTGSMKIALPIVAIRVRGQGQREFIRTHALLDHGSTKTFCAMSTVDRLGLQGKRTTLSLNTLSSDTDADAVDVALDITAAGSNRMKRRVLHLPHVYALKNFPSLKNSMAVDGDISRWEYLHDLDIPKDADSDVTMIIGQDYPQLLMPIEVRHGCDGEPYATRTKLGWTLNGPIDTKSGSTAASYFINTELKQYPGLDAQVEQFWKLDTHECLANNLLQMSVDDRKVLSMWDESVTQNGRHYVLNIPFKTDPPELSDNREVAETRLHSLKRRFIRNPELHAKYTEGIERLLQRGYAEVVQEHETDTYPETKWYLPHHNVVNPNKPEKTRIVFDCAAVHKGTSLNTQVLQGPDLTNTLLGVLLRFRENKVAMMSDVEEMFHQVQVPPEHRDVLRFLWWEKGDTSQKPQICRMTVHLFGGVWSPSAACFSLRRTAEDNKEKYDPETVSTVMENFYVDDCLKSVETEEAAIRLISQLRAMLQLGGFRLTKWITNSRRVLATIPEEERAKEVRNLDLDIATLPVERALGVQWDTESDIFSIRVKSKEKDLTRRGLLSILSSVYDPLGLVAPYILKAKMIFQSECRSGKGWDDRLDEHNIERWNRWLKDLPILEQFEVERCITPVSFGAVVESRIHHFCDASQDAYGSVSYMRSVNTEGKVHVALLLGKSRLAPIKTMTIPRLELTAAVVAVKVDRTLQKELQRELQDSVFWTDSTIVLQYIRNRTRRFHTFVSNRIAMIHEASSPRQWRHIDSKNNPADDSSRGLDAEDMVSNDRWTKGPDFLWKQAEDWPGAPDAVPDLQDNDKEVKVETKACAIEAEVQEEDLFNKLLLGYSSWYRLRKAVAWLLRIRRWLLDKAKGKKQWRLNADSMEPTELHRAEVTIVTHLQEKHFKEERIALQTDRDTVSKKSAIYRLEPFLDQDGLLRVKGRMENAPFEDSMKHPVILPRYHHVSEIIIRDIHENEAGHSGREHVLSLLRQRYWIPQARPLINRILRSCIVCKRLLGKPEPQRMADLPSDRVTPGKPPFTNVGVDCFGPVLVKRGRGQEKRYGCLFTCLAVRAIHVEKLHSLDSDSFVSALMRFTCRRGVPDKIRSDNGTNFVGGEKEIRESIQQWNQNQKTRKLLLLKEITWEFNPPAAPHMGGIWERQVRTVKKVFNAILRNQVLTDEKLDTFFCEAESIVNSRPLTYVSDSPQDPEPLTPNHLLLLRSGPTGPMGDVSKDDVYGRRWRHIQYLANQFWKRWVREYIPLLLHRQKWLKRERNLQEGDVVLVTDEATPRRSWPLGRVLQVFPGRDGLVRSAKVKTAWTVLNRPVSKLCYLESVTEQH